MRKERIYILGDDRSVASIKMRFLTEGFDLQAFTDANELLAQLEAKPPDLLLHTDYPGGDEGIQLCIRLREKSTAVIILLGDELSNLDTIGALSVGADICVSKSLSSSVLIAQIHACFRRSKLYSRDSVAQSGSNYLVDTPALRIDVRSRSVIVDYNPVPLTAREFDILALLASHPNQVFYTSQIFQSVWDADSILSGDDRTVSVHISNLRKKIEGDPLNPRHIITIRGVGYKFQVDD